MDSHEKAECGEVPRSAVRTTRMARIEEKVGHVIVANMAPMRTGRSRMVWLKQIPPSLVFDATPSPREYKQRVVGHEGYYRQKL